MHDLALERFGADGIARTEMGERVGYYGDPLLEARVVLTAEPEDADVEALVSFPLQLMRHLEGLGEGRPLCDDPLHIGFRRRGAGGLNPDDCLKTAAVLLAVRRGKPRQSDVRRAVSTIYYALFHLVCRNAADCLIGTAGADRSGAAWQQVYRSVEHRFASNQCRQVVARGFPAGIAEFALAFVVFQEQRHAADCDPAARFFRSETRLSLSPAESALAAFQRPPSRTGAPLRLGSRCGRVRADRSGPACHQSGRDP